VLDTNSGKVVATAACVGDTDDLFYDAARRRLYIAGGAGSVTVVEQRSPDRYEPVATMPTASGARTALFVPEWRRLFLAVPHRGAQQAEIRVYATE
jgi:hypothetical protein